MAQHIVSQPAQTQVTPARRPVAVEQPASEAVQARLAGIARYITAEYPNAVMTEDQREYLARATAYAWRNVHATVNGRLNQDRLDAFREALYSAMPEPRDGETCADYASRIRREQAVAHTLQAVALAKADGWKAAAASFRADADLKRQELAS